jgi:hypothetical protein
VAPNQPKKLCRPSAMGGAGAVLSTFRVALPTAYDGIERNRSPKYPTASRWIPTTTTRKHDLREVIGPRHASWHRSIIP